MIDKKKVRRIVIESSIHTIVAFITMSILLFIVIILTARFGSWRLIIPVLLTTGGMSLVFFFLSEIVIVTLTRGYQATPDKHPRFIQAVEKICRKKRMKIPRLRILQFPVPNACAFGIGFFGQCAIGITEELYNLLDAQELEGVLAHEIAHIRCRDVGIMTVIAIITGGASQLANILKKGETKLGKTPIAIFAGLLILALSRLILPIGRNAISQERERVADALGASYVGSSQPLIRALKKLGRKLDVENQPTFLDSLLISHPGMETRIKSLEALEQ